MLFNNLTKRGVAKVQCQPRSWDENLKMKTVTVVLKKNKVEEDTFYFLQKVYRS